MQGRIGQSKRATIGGAQLVQACKRPVDVGQGLKVDLIYSEILRDSGPRSLTHFLDR
jgi:hypothetical protein